MAKGNAMKRTSNSRMKKITYKEYSAFHTILGLSNEEG
jgi:hypothetical protein